MDVRGSDAEITRALVRRIDSIDAVDDVLSSPRASFTELLDCVRIAKAASAWDLMEAAASAALTRAVGTRARAVRSLSEAAEAVAMSFIYQVEQLADLPPTLRAADARLSELSSGALSASAAHAVDLSRARLEAVMLLCGDSQPASLVKLCRELRHLDRPDLGREAASLALTAEPGSGPALTTRGAAALDEGDVVAAISDLRQAWAIEQTVHAGTALARALLEAGQPFDALQLARDVARRWPGPYSAVTYARAARDADAEDDFQIALNLIADVHLEDVADRDPRDRWIITRAADELVRANRLDEADRLVQGILERGRYQPALKLQREIRRLRRGVQERLPVADP